MKSKLDPTTTPEQKFARFQNAMRTVLQVSKEDSDRMIEEAAQIRRMHKRKPGPKPSGSGRAVDGKA
jgi:hypothetical protein